MAHIEHHPENGRFPWIAVVRSPSGSNLWFAHPTREDAEGWIQENGEAWELATKAIRNDH